MSQTALSYVRTEMLPPQRPPISQVGAARWLRENLFDGWISTLLTVVSVAITVWLVARIAPWLAHSVWNAESLAECRRIVADAGGSSGACWAVIRVNLNQLIYGFYPADLYWRPNLAFVLMLVAGAPVLFPDLPRRMLWFSVAFPFIGFWLIWGGSVWVPVLVLVGLSLAVAAFVVSSATAGTLWSVAAGLLIFWMMFGDPISFGLDAIGLVLGLPTLTPGIAWAWGLIPYPTLGIEAVALNPTIGGGAIRDILPVFGPAVAMLDSLAPVALQPVASRDFGGFLVSLVIGVTAISLSLPLGILLALARRSDMPLVKGVAVVFIEFVRGVPLITLLFTASILLNYFLPPGTNFDLILRVIIMTTLFASAYMAEVIRGGLAALPRGQYEAAASLGLDYWKSMRLIILPQALKISIPGIVNTFIGLFKDTTLVSFVGIFDPIGRANAIRANADWQGIYWELFIFVGAVFFVFCWGMSRYSMYLERRLRTDHR
jgi:general L-amino acid transport system permease protein